MKDILLTIILIASIPVFFYGMFYHRQFVHLGGQKGLYIVPTEEQTTSMKLAFRGMKIGYGLFGGLIVLMAVITSIFGPIQI